MAKALPLSSRRKIVFCCTDASTMVSRDHKGISAFCFRCGFKDWEPAGHRSIAEILADRRATEELKQAQEIPSSAVPLTTGPLEAWQWVLKGGMTPEEADGLGWRWHEQTRRVLIPVTGGFLGRSIYGDKPKYIMRGTGGLYWALSGAHTALVVVEDILSALAIKRTGGSAVAVLGTSLTEQDAAQIATVGDVVIGWFDGDRAGDRAWVKLRKKLSLHPVELRRIRTEQDPKRLHRATINEHIRRATE